MQIAGLASEECGMCEGKMVVVCPLCRGQGFVEWTLHAQHGVDICKCAAPVPTESAEHCTRPSALRLLRACTANLALTPSELRLRCMVHPPAIPVLLSCLP